MIAYSGEYLAGLSRSTIEDILSSCLRDQDNSNPPSAEVLMVCSLRNTGAMRLVASVLLLLTLIPGCASRPAAYQKAVIHKPFKSEPPDPQIIRGKKNVVIDGLGHYVFSLPAKLILWNWHVDDHKVSNENEAIIRKYMEVNGLTTTQVRLNTYAPQKEFARLKKNKDVHWAYKYTLGTFSVIFYTLLPERLFAGLIGGDHYNPFTNTINVYSDHPAILIHEAGHSKDFGQRRRRGSYAFARILPFVDLYQEYLPSEDAVTYFYCRRDKTNELNAYPILEPAYATYISNYLPWGGGGLPIIAAHIHGRMKRSERREALAQPEYGTFRGTCWAEGEAQPTLASPASKKQSSPGLSPQGESSPTGGSREGSTPGAGKGLP